MNEIIKYIKPNEEIVINVKFDHQNLWLTQKSMSELFDKDTDTIGLHLKNIYAEKELEENSTTEFFSVVQKEGNRNVKRKIKFYNIDAIISVGYRVSSYRGTQFRIWATKVLKEKLLQKQQPTDKERSLVQVVKYIHRITQGKELQKEEAQGLLNVISEYTFALEMLDQFDHNVLEYKSISQKQAYRLTIEEVRSFIKEMKNKFSSSAFFGVKKKSPDKYRTSTGQVRIK